uniref:auxin-induced protein X15 n=1 Tax=Fragaria vesca subsp. vesca TaxID=101020 RepID=UPI0005CA6445|nr:PREDICTED: auxin-induced protein X15 [Fragaria vesca subsp. vesca]
MGIRLQEIVVHAKHIMQLRRHAATSSKNQIRCSSTASSNVDDVPKGHFAIYVGVEEEKKERFVVPISYLKQPIFQDLLLKAAEEFGYDQTGGITLPCGVEDFTSLTSRLNYVKS